jgi:glycosyltransferase involved in cell wall biosynthesis
MDVIYSYYTEPYNVAAHIVAKATGVPHLVRTAGSDAGRLWSLPQFRALYDYIFKSADAIICGPVVAQKMVQAGVKPARIASNPEIVPFRELFRPDGIALDIELLRNEVATTDSGYFRDLIFGTYDPSLIYFGVYGKLGRVKGTYALLEAIKRLKNTGLRVGVLLMGHDLAGTRGGIREYVISNGLEDRVFQLPYLPHWRVSEFIRRCEAVCCLEQDFPINFHTPVVAREVLTCGGCLVGSTELIQKARAGHKLIDDYNCIAVRDVQNVDDLERRLVSVVDDPEITARTKLRAREYGLEIEADNKFPQKLESILRDLSRTGRLSPENMARRANQAAADQSHV